jgi:hypothetical protein
MDVNPFFSPTEAECLNTFISVAHFHSKDAFTSALTDTLLMPYPDKDTICALVTSGLLDTSVWNHISILQHPLILFFLWMNFETGSRAVRKKEFDDDLSRIFIYTFARLISRGCATQSLLTK